MTIPWMYKIYINGELVETTNKEGMAHLKFETAVLTGSYAQLLRFYNGDNFDPVLHSPVLLREENNPPCPPHGKCKWRKSMREAFLSSTRPTAFRIEIPEPQDRCGWMLKPGCLGGSFYDYGCCILPLGEEW